jgi:hypothetical protein
MLAFGVGENYDQSGNYIDARNANFAMMVSPTASFSAAAAQALLSWNIASPTTTTLGAQELNVQPVPEPATVLLWAAAAAGAILVHRKRSR